MPNYDSFGQLLPTFKEDPLAAQQNIRPNDAIGESVESVIHGNEFKRIDWGLIANGASDAVVHTLEPGFDYWILLAISLASTPFLLADLAPEESVTIIGIDPSNYSVLFELDSPAFVFTQINSLIAVPFWAPAPDADAREIGSTLFGPVDSLSVHLHLNGELEIGHNDNSDGTNGYWAVFQKRIEDNARPRGITLTPG